MSEEIVRGSKQTDIRFPQKYHGRRRSSRSMRRRRRRMTMIRMWNAERYGDTMIVKRRLGGCRAANKSHRKPCEGWREERSR